MYVLNYYDIRAILPHRYPMLLVDGVVSLEPNRSIVAVKCVSGAEFCYEQLAEHADVEDTAYPYSLIIESLGQAGAILGLQSVAATTEQAVLLFAAMRDCSFEALVFPGDTMEHRVTIERIIGEHMLMSGETWVRQTRIARVESIILTLKTPSAPINAPSVDSLAT